jgi:hypothetical protein
MFRVNAGNQQGENHEEVHVDGGIARGRIAGNR